MNYSLLRAIPEGGIFHYGRRKKKPRGEMELGAEAENRRKSPAGLGAEAEK